MFKFKKSFYLVILLLILTAWLSANFAKNQPLFSNPFAEQHLAERTKGIAGDLYDGAKKAVKDQL